MYKGKAIIGKSIDSQGRDYFYFDGKDIAVKTFGNTVQEAIYNARTQFNDIVQEALEKDKTAKQRIVRLLDK